MDEKKFKRTFKPPSCTMSPWYNLIPKDQRDQVMRNIRHETIEAYGYSMDECPKRKTCLTKSCVGRPLPWKSKTAEPYLKILQQTHNIQNDELFISNCDTCKIAKTCKSPCYQVNDFLNRATSKEAELVPQENLENHVIENPEIIENIQNFITTNSNIPWDCLTDTRKLVIKKYLYENKDFAMIAKEMDLNNQARVKYEFYSALTRLSEFAVMRKFIKDNENNLTPKQLNTLNSIYSDNLSITDVAKKEKVSKQAIQQSLTRVVDKYNIKWSVFVTKNKNKIIYNVSGLFK